MPRLTADFANISTEFTELPDGEYRARIEDIVSSETRENKLPQLQFKLKVVEGAMEGKPISDFVTLMTKDGKPNEIGLGRVKAYAAAILGDEAANGGEIDTDELKLGTVVIVVKQETRKDKPNDPARAQIKKVMADR